PTKFGAKITRQNPKSILLFLHRSSTSPASPCCFHPSSLIFSGKANPLPEPLLHVIHGDRVLFRR
ncbi:hypothetical protein HN51_054503, partial [Arachis hypogaea]